MAKKQKEQPVLTLDGKEYFAKDMTDEQLRIKDHLGDLNNKLNRNSNLLQLLSKQDLSNKVLTLEVYDDMDVIKASYQLLEEIIY